MGNGQWAMGNGQWAMGKTNFSKLNLQINLLTYQLPIYRDNSINQLTIQQFDQSTNFKTLTTNKILKTFLRLETFWFSYATY